QLLCPHPWGLDQTKARQGFEALAEIADVPLRIQEGWRPDTVRLSTPSLRDWIDGVDYKVEWHDDRDERRLLALEGWDEAQLTCWRYLDHSSVRQTADSLFAPSFVIWDRPSTTESTSPDSSMFPPTE
ncbi:MAG: hypothetical protein ABEN55_20815, partial [Bradymonadaceae bacterium]